MLSIDINYKNIVKKYSSGMTNNKFQFKQFIEKKIPIERSYHRSRILYKLLDFEEIQQVKNKLILINLCREVLFHGNFCPIAVARKVLNTGNKLLILLFCELFSVKHRKDYIRVFHREITQRRKLFYLIDEVEEIMSGYYNGIIVLRKRANETQALYLFHENSDEIINIEELKKLPPIGSERDNVDKIIERMINWNPLF